MNKMIRIGSAGICCTILLALLAPVPAAQADDGVPAALSLTLPGGSSNVGTNGAVLTSTNVYTVGITSPARSSFQPLALEYSITGTLAADATLTLRRKAGGPIYTSIAIPSNSLSGVSFITNKFYFIRLDQIYATCSATNAGTVAIQGLEE